MKEIIDKIRDRLSEDGLPLHRVSGDTIEILRTVQGAGNFKAVLEKTITLFRKKHGINGAVNFLRHFEISAGLRKPSLAVYDHAFHFIGGAQKYGLTLLKALEDRFDTTILANRNVTHTDFRNWYGLDMGKSDIKVIRIPWFDVRNTSHIDPHRILKGTANPFHVISRESGNYDVFINNGMLEMVYPLSLVSVLICHFPERRPQSYFYSDIYTYTVYNSEYTAEWIRKRWNYTPHKHIYPPVDMEVCGPRDKKEKIILSVARLEEGGTKKQKEMAETFIRMKEDHPEETKGWRLIIAGGSTGNNSYLPGLREIVERSGNDSIQLKINISGDDLRALYKQASVFWHLCGLGENDPARVEHFGMTIGEAMQNRIAPVVFDGGGQREIVEQGVSGFRVSSLNGLIRATLKLMGDPLLIKRIGENAHRKSLKFNRERFEQEVSAFFRDIIPPL